METTLSNNLEQDLLLVEQELQKALHSEDKLISQVNSYLFSAKGKRVRPVLLLLSYRANKEILNEECIISAKEAQFASAVEMIHVASVIHDDVIENSCLRRGKETINLLWGNRISTIMGDFLFARAAYLMTKNKDIEILEILTKVASVMCEGEAKQAKSNFNLNIAEDEYFNVIRAKTASLISASCEIGAVLSGAKDNCRKMFMRFGLNMGTAFQIIDDVLDFVSSPKDLGKPVGADLKEGRVTLPVIYCMKSASEEDKKIIKDIFNPEMNGKFAVLLDILKKYNAIEYSKNKAMEFVNKAKNELSDIPDVSSKLDLFQIADYIINRNC